MHRRPRHRQPLAAVLSAVLGVAVLTGALVTVAGTATAPPASAEPAAALAPGRWEVSFSWYGTASYGSATLTSSSQFFGNGIGSLAVDADSVAGPFGITALVQGRGTATGAGGYRATGGSSDATWEFAGTFGGSATEPCLTGSVAVGGMFDFQDDAGLIFMPLDGIEFPMACGDWPIRITSVRCNVFEGEWAWARTLGLSAAGYRFTGSPSRVWGVRVGRSERSAQASAEAMRALTEEARVLASSSPLAVDDLRQFLRAARTRLPRAAAACGGDQTDVELQVFTRVLIANLLGQGTPLGPDVLIEVADFAARAGAFDRPRTDLGTTTLTELDAAFRALPTDPAVTQSQLLDAADAARRLGLRATADRLDQEGALREPARR